MKNLEEKTWEEFRDTGLLLIINQLLHIFGWAITVQFDGYDRETDTGTIQKVFPARTLFRGFSEKSADINYKKVGRYMKENADKLYNEAFPE